MRSTCPTCDTAYTIPDDRIGPKGRKVRCTKCGDEWRVFLAEVAEAPAEPVAPPPEPVVVAAKPKPAPPPVEEAFDPFAEIDAGSEPDPTDAAEAPEPSPEPEETPAAEPEATADAEPPVPRPSLAPARPRLRKKLRPILRPLPDLPILARRALPFVGPLVFVCACLVVAALIVLRTTIVAAAPDLAGLYAAIGLEVNLRGLAFTRIETLREVENGQPVLVVEGAITNTTRQSREVPAVRFALRDADTQELYAWAIEPRAAALAAGDSVRFRTRLAAPPERATDIQVRFIERHNQQAGL